MVDTTIKKDVIYKTGVLELNGQLKYNIIHNDWYLVGSINLDDERMNMRVSGNEKNDLIGIVDTKRSKIHSTSQVTIMTLFDHYGKGKIFNDHFRIVFPAGDKKVKQSSWDSHPSGSALLFSLAANHRWGFRKIEYKT